MGSLTYQRKFENHMSKKLFLAIVLFVIIIVIALLLMLQINQGIKHASSQPTSNTAAMHSDSTHQFSVSDTANLPNEYFYLYHHRQSIHSPFGFPADADTSDDFILKKHQYILSYCPNKNVANWVAWELNHTWVGDENRYNGRFISDTTLPVEFYRVTHNDYTNSGFDRGHIVRSKERTTNSEDNKATFLLTNIIPQTPDLNRGVWLRFEDYYLKKAVDENKNMYIVSGGIFKSDTTLLGKGKVAIPDSCFKIVLFTEKKSLEEISSLHDFEIVAVSMPNVQGIRNHDWRNYVTTVNQIEASTGYDFLILLPDSIEDALEERILERQ